MNQELTRTRPSVSESRPTIPPPEQSMGWLRRLVVESAAVTLLLLAALLVATVVIFDDVRIFHAGWVLHPDETGILFISSHLAEAGSFVVSDAWYQQSPAHVPVGVTAVDDKLVPQKALLGYVVYAGAFLVSDSAWMYVGPFFGLLAACAAGWLVLEKTKNRWVAMAAAFALGTSSPMILYASGLAFTDVIALAFYLLGVVAFHRHMKSGSRRALVAVGLAFGAATLTRYDFFVAGVLALGIALWFRREEADVKTNLRRALPGVAPFAAMVALAAVANWWLYGSPFTTGYQAGSWQTSPASVGGSLFDFGPVDFADLSQSYLIQIGLSCTLLLGLGVAAKYRLRRWDATDGLLLGFAGFGLFYFLGKEGAYGTSEAWLVGSYPRYLLPVYAAGAVVGIEGVFGVLRAFQWNHRPTSVALVALALVAAAIGMHEAFGSNERGVAYVERLTNSHRFIATVAEQTPEQVVVVSDLNTKAVFSARTITPFRAGLTADDVVADVRTELNRGRNVIVVGDQRSHPLYTGYVEALRESDIQLIPRRCSMEIYQAYLPGQAPFGVPTSCRT